MVPLNLIFDNLFIITSGLSISPRNFNVRWIDGIFVHRTSAPDALRCRCICSSISRHDPGIGIAINVRIKSLFAGLQVRGFAGSV